MSSNLIATLAMFLAGSSLVVIVDMLLRKRKTRAEERVDEMTHAGTTQDRFAKDFGAQPTIMALAETEIARRSKQTEKADKMKARLVQAGLYQKNAANVFGAVKAVCMVVPVVIGFIAGKMGVVTLGQGLFIGALVGFTGNLAPSFWLDHVKRLRQKFLRRALPDALDVITVCLKGGMSLSAALSRVARELATAHPMLALELAIVERETQMGRTTGDAMRAFAERFDLEEVRSLSSVISQAEKFGSSVTKAMETYAETLRLKRHQRAEEMAQKAVVKIIFPTLLCIFPGIFVVVLGPAAIRIYQVLVKGALHG